MPAPPGAAGPPAGRHSAHTDDDADADDSDDAAPDPDDADDDAPDAAVPRSARLAALLPAAVHSRFEVSRRGAIGVVVLALAAACIAAVLAWRSRPAPITADPPAIGVSTSSASTPGAASMPPATGPPPTPSRPLPTSITVAVVGQVHRPGIVALASGARVADALRAAGGTKPGARLGLLNLAQPLADGDEVVVDVPGSGSQVVGPVPVGGSGAGPPDVPGASTPAAPVNLNTATAEQLDALPGVGPVTAQKILDFRTTNGPFTSVDQLREISGIGDAKFAAMSKLVTV